MPNTHPDKMPHEKDSTETMLYIHIPFCEQKCIYCDFYSIARKELLNDYFQALLQELTMQKDRFQTAVLSSIYIGGGTPSILSVDRLQILFDHVTRLFPITKNIEITQETNPEHLTPEYLKALKQYTPVNRLSIGIQAFQDDLLKQLNRRHNGNEAIKAVKAAQDIGFDNIGIDLIYALPGLSDRAWEENLEKAFMCQIQHLSAYCLTVAEKTMLHTLIKKRKIMPADEETALRHFEILCRYADEHGFEHYEISNFSLPGYRSKHNSGYWSFKPYIGVGASAHGFNGQCRQWNIDSVKEYIAAIEKGVLPCQKEILNAVEHFNEQVFLGLRRKEGIFLPDIEDDFLPLLLNNAQDFIHQKLLSADSSHLRLTRKGIMLSDRIASSLFALSEEQ